MKLKEKLTMLREEKKLSQSQLAETLHVSRQAVSRWETGEAVPSVDNLRYLSKLYDVALDYLLDDEADEVTRGTAVEAAVSLPEEKRKHHGRWLVWAIVLLCALLAVVFYRLAAGGDEEKAVSIDDIPIQEVKPDNQMQFDLTW